MDQRFSGIRAFIVEDCLLLLLFLPPKETLVRVGGLFVLFDSWLLSEYVDGTGHPIITCSSEGSVQVFCKSLLHCRLTAGTNNLRHVLVT